MKLIVFLGNPGLKYRKTRHNIGFMLGDELTKQRKLKWKYDKKFAAEIARDGDMVFAKPQLFYNLTGDSVQAIMKFFKINKSDILVVCDDFNLDFGKLRLREKGSHGGNNGLKSISSHIGDGFARLRIGTDNEKRKIIGDTNFVLSKFSREEQTELPAIFSEAQDTINRR